ncbi:MAG: glycogen-binding domain-containing protein [Desulfobacteraceae bacterium]|nr:glycogen-binding domain-containing protein [Desulfobacteraceae bacterium]
MLDVKSKQKSKVISEMKIKRRRVNFSLEATEAKEIILIGDFNNWNTKKHPMHKDKNGMWVKTVIIPSGKYEYKFLVDGQWKEDPKNNQTCLNCFGTQNSVLDLT